MSKRHTVRLVSEGGALARLFLDDEDISRSVSAVDIHASARDGIGVNLHLVAAPLAVDLTDVEVWLPEETRNLLIRMGWTPPEEEGTDVLD